MVDLFGHVVVESRGVRGASCTANGIAVLFVPSRGASLGFWHGVSHLLSLGGLRGAWGRRYRRCCFGHGIGMSLSRSWFVFISIEARASV